jgi:hypothetical protein
VDFRPLTVGVSWSRPVFASVGDRADAADRVFEAGFDPADRAVQFGFQARDRPVHRGAEIGHRGFDHAEAFFEVEHFGGQRTDFAEQDPDFFGLAVDRFFQRVFER